MLTLAKHPAVTDSADDPVPDLLRQLIVEVQGLRADLTRDRRPRTLSREDRLLLARLLPPIAGVFGSELFTSRELLESDAAALKVALRGLNGLKVGRVLQRGEGQVIAGLMVRREGVESHAALWRIIAVSEFLGVSEPPETPRGDSRPAGDAVE